MGAHGRLLSGALDVEDVLVPKGDFLTMVQVLGEEKGDVSEVAVEGVSVAAGDVYPHPFGLVGVDESDADGVAGIGGVADPPGGDLEGIWVLALGCNRVQEFDRGSRRGLVGGFHGFCSFRCGLLGGVVGSLEGYKQFVCEDVCCEVQGCSWFDVA